MFNQINSSISKGPGDEGTLLHGVVHTHPGAGLPPDFTSGLSLAKIEALGIHLRLRY